MHWGRRTTAQPGLEPGKADPNSAVLPITPPGKLPDQHKATRNRLIFKMTARTDIFDLPFLIRPYHKRPAKALGQNRPNRFGLPLGPGDREYARTAA